MANYGYLWMRRATKKEQDNDALAKSLRRVNRRNGRFLSRIFDR